MRGLSISSRLIVSGKHPLFWVVSCRSSGWFNCTKPSLREGSRRFDALKPSRTSAHHPAHIAYPVKMELHKVRYSRTTPNSCKGNFTHVASSPTMWFEKVRKGSMCLNHPELVHITLHTLLTL